MDNNEENNEELSDDVKSNNTFVFESNIKFVEDNDDKNSTIPDRTIYETNYEPKILRPWKENKKRTKKSSSKIHNNNNNNNTLTFAKDVTILLSNENAEKYGNISHVGYERRLNYAFQEYEEEKKRYVATKHEIVNDPNKLLEITTATIILLAKQIKSIPLENYMFAEIYLKSIRNEYGNHPPNIGYLLKHLRYLKRKRKIDWGSIIEREVPENLKITKIRKQSKIPVCCSYRNSNLMSLSSVRNENIGKSESKIMFPVNKNESEIKNKTSVDNKVTINDDAVVDDVVTITSTDNNSIELFDSSKTYNKHRKPRARRTLRIKVEADRNH